MDSTRSSLKNLEYPLSGAGNAGVLSEEQELDLVRKALQGAVAGKDYREGEALFYLGYDPEEEQLEHARDVARIYGGELSDYQHGMGLIALPDGSEEGEERVTTWDAVERSLEDESLPVVEPNYFSRVYEDELFDVSDSLQSVTSEDPYLDRDSDDYQWHHELLHSKAVWEAGYTGSSDIKVAVIDTGVTKRHEDLTHVEQMTTTRSTGTRLPLEPDSLTHGTHVAGIIGADAGNGRGGAGVAPGVTILSYNVQPSDAFASVSSDFDDPGDGEEEKQSIGLDDYAIMSSIANSIGDGADIINMSLGGPGYSYNYQRVINDAYNAGITIFAAMGNEYANSMTYPAAYDHVIAVASVGLSKARSDFSNFGSWCDIAAPGNEIVSTVVPRLSGDVDYYGFYIYDGKYGTMSGTSMATPVAAGCAALYMSVYGNPGPAAMEKLIKESTSPSASEEIGAGVIDAAKLMGVDCSFTTVSAAQTRSTALEISGKEFLKPGGSAQYKAYLTSRRSSSEFTNASWSVAGSAADYVKFTEKNGFLKVKLGKKAPLGSTFKIRAVAPGALTSELTVTVSKVKTKSLRVWLNQETSGNVTVNTKGSVTGVTLYGFDHPETPYDDRCVELVQTGGLTSRWSLVSDKDIVSLTGEGLEDPDGVIKLAAKGIGSGTLICEAPDNGGRRLEIPIRVVSPPSGIGIYAKSLSVTDSANDCIVGAGNSVAFDAVLTDGYGDVTENADIKWSIVGYGGLKKKAITGKSVSINKNGKLKVKSDVFNYYNGDGTYPCVVIQASLADGSGIAGEELVYISPRVTKLKKIRYWSEIWLDEVVNEHRNASPELYGTGSAAVLFFTSRRALGQWIVTSSDPSVASGYIVSSDYSEKSGVYEYCIYLTGGAKNGYATITVKALDGGNKSVTWRVENKG